MTLIAGTRLGRYEIRSKLGEGGMGEVYRARDEKLNRDVAIKVLSAEFSRDADRLRRFEQEAQSAGSLNHPNIVAVYDVGTHDEAPYVVTELLEGESLKDRLQHGPLAQRKAIEFGIQIASGLAAAHGKGIIHRDIKPDNLFVTKDDRVKILDFGIAKLIEPFSNNSAQTDIATRKVHTDPGSVLGTVGYMSPEQVRGLQVDHRSDIFSFGAVLYEMLSGQRAFRGDSAIETLNSILKDEPKELGGNANISPAMERVVWHCLEKSPERRFQSATDAAFGLESVSGISSGSTQATPLSPRVQPKNRERLVWIALSALLFVIAGAFAIAYFSQPSAAVHSIRLSLSPPDKNSPPARLTVSPDGQRFVFLANDAEGKRLLWVRPLDSLTAQPLTGTEGAAAPFWSPDSLSIGYFANGKLYRVEASGGRPQTLCNVTDDRGGAWSPGGVILFAGLEGLNKVSAQGGSPVVATKISGREEAHHWPYFLPDGRHFVFLADASRSEDHHLRLGTLDSQDTQGFLDAISRVVYAPPGYLLYVRQGALVAVSFDARSLKVTGQPVAIADHIASVGGNHEFDFSASDQGVLTYQTSNPNSQLIWFDRTGQELGPAGNPNSYGTLALSPDDHRVAVTLDDADGRAADVWVLDLVRNNISRVTFDPAGDGGPVWSADGSKIIFSSNRSGPQNLFEKGSSGGGDDRELFRSDAEKSATSCSPNGQYLLFNNFFPNNQGGIWLLPLTGDRQPRALLESQSFVQTEGRFSPDGRFITYMSHESGRYEVYVRPFPLTDDKLQISSGGGAYPLWRGDGKELFHITPDGVLMSAELKTAGKLESSIPKELFRTKIKYSARGATYGVSADGQRFLVNTLTEGDNPAQMTVVLNWTADLKK